MLDSIWEGSHLMTHKSQHTITDDSGTRYNITGLKSSVPKIILTALLTLLTGGLILLVMHWYPKILVFLTKRKANLPSATYIHVKAESHEIEEISKVTAASGMRYFIFQNLKYVWDDSCFDLVNGLEDMRYSDFHNMSGGLTSTSLAQKVERYGLNTIDVPVPPYTKLFYKEALKPFYIFQLFAVCLWMWDDYRAYATAILVISIVSIGLTIFEEQKQNKKINTMAASSVDVTVIRNCKMQTIRSSELVPGDVILIPRGGMLLCCDAVIVSGAAIVNECALTGESIPATKAPIPYISKIIYDGDVKMQRVSEDLVYDPNKDKKYSLYSGTTVIQVKPSVGTKLLAIVTKTGFSTFKGSLIRYILCPKPTKFEFESDAKRFIIMLSMFAVCGFVYTCYISMKLGASISKTIRLGLDLITTVVPPALPAALTIGVVYAVQRMKKKNIFCIDPQRVNFCGKIQYICFDKTGTLTEDGLSVLGVIPTSNKHMFGTLVDSATQLNTNILMYALATCHELTFINGELVGDPMDIEMFKFTQWELEENFSDNSLTNFVCAIVRPKPDTFGYKNPEMEIVDPEIGIIKSFPFTSDVQRMSVVIKELLSEDLLVFCKGSPEMILTLSNTNSIPFNFHSVLESYTKEGYRVIALAWKSLDPDINWHNIQTMKRSDAECDLHFLGFLVMENHLKEDTAGCIRDLVLSNSQVCMVTGDNILTAITVGKKCGIIPALSTKHDVIVVRKYEESVSFQLDFQEESAVTLSDIYTHEDIVEALNKVTANEHVFAISEKDYNHVAEFHPLIYELLLLQGKIFARMTPGNKQKLVEDLKGIGYIVSMCGDGANDCGALKSAHAGVSLSEAEASIAAPFTSSTASISCMIEILRQGRAALVTASVTFRFMAMYSMIQFISQLHHYSIGANMTDNQFLYIDMFIISGIAATLGHSRPSKLLAPCTPKAQLIDLKVFVLLTLHVILTFAFQFSCYMYIRSQPFFVPYTPNDDWKEGRCYENTALFLCSCNQYLLYGIVLSVGAPHRMPVYRNWTLMSVFLIFTVLSVLFVLQPIPFLTNLVNLMSLQTNQCKLTFVILMMANFFLALTLEEIFSSPGVTQCLENIRIIDKKRARYLNLRDQWGTVYNDFNVKSFYR